MLFALSWLRLGILLGALFLVATAWTFFLGNTIPD